MMNQANREDEADLERTLLGDTNSPDEKESQSSKLSEERPCKMHSTLLRRLLITVFVLSLIGLGLVSATCNNKLPQKHSAADLNKFRGILSAVEPSSLHDLLHEHVDEYKEGVYPDDVTAVAAVHQQNAEAANSLVALAKKQESNATTTAVTVTTSSIVIQETTETVIQSTTSSVVITDTSSSSSSQETTPPVEEPTPPTTSDVSTPPPAASTPTPVASPTTSEAVVDQSTTTTSPPSVPSSSSSSGNSRPASTTTSTTIAPTRTPSNSSSPSGSDSRSESSSPLESPTSTSQSVTSFYLTTSKLPNGDATTITQTTIVPAGSPDQTAVGGKSTKSAVAGSLQSNVANVNALGRHAVLGAIGMVVFGGVL